MPRVHFTRHLNRYFPTLQETEVTASTVREAVEAMERVYPGLSDYLLDDHGALRKHVHLFVGQEFIRDRQTLSDPLAPEDELHVMQALSGGC